MATGNLFGSGGESNSLYGTSLSATPSSFIYFEWFIFKVSTGQPATPTGGSWDFLTNTGIPPAGWVSSINGVPLDNLWFSIAFVDSRNPTNITWSTTGLISAATSIYASAYADKFTGNGSTTSWTLSADPVTVNNLDVSLNGVTQTPTTDYTISGTTFTTTTAAPLGSILLVKYRQALPTSYYGLASNVGFTPTSWIASTNVQSALAEVATDISATDGVSGSNLVGYKPAGTGAVATTVQAKLRQSVSVIDFGADPTGVANSTAAIQAAVNASGQVYFPPGTYQITHIDLNSYNQIIGSGWNTIIHQITGTNPRPGAYDGMFTINYTNNATPTKNVVFRDLQLRMDTPTGAYTLADEQSHIILGGHTENIIIDNCFFYGWRGDAIFLGAQMSGVGVPTNYVAQNSSITNCKFDGINNTCRQAITGGSVDGMFINNNYFLNVTRATMPGAIDFEAELPYAYTRNISINSNIFVGVGPAGTRRPALVVDLGNLSPSSSDRRGNLTFSENYLNSTDGFYFKNGIINDVTINGNWIYGTVNTDAALLCNNLILSNNLFYQCQTILIGYPASTVYNANIYGNTFDTCGSTSAALQVNTVINGGIFDNQFIDCGGSGHVAIQFAGGGTQTGITVHDNVFSAPTGLTTTALASSGTQDAASIFHDNVFRDNIAPGNWQNGYYLNGNGMISSTTVSFATNANTILYYVPTNKRLVLTKAVVIGGASTGATTISIGQSTATSDFVPANTLSNIAAANDAVILVPVTSTTPAKIKSYAAGTIISCTVASAAGGATNIVQLYGTFI